MVATIYLVAGLLVAPVLMYRLASFLHVFLNNLKPMKISEIYVYPIKSLRATKVPEAVATKHGFQYDRRFMLLEVTPDGYKNMAVSRYPEMTQFLTEIETDSSGSGSITVKFKAFGNADQTKTLQVPLLPDVEKLEPFEVTMHNSPTQAYKMPAKYNDWFTSCFGYEVLFVYLGENRRNVLFEDMVLPPRPTWIRNIAQKYPFLGIPVDEQFQITFADCAPYLIVSKTSLEDVSARLPDGEDMDVTKFRPNIVLEGAGKPWEEDFWGRIKIKDAEIIMQHNCVRCKSINIDYETGKPGTGPSGEVLKKLQKDRRVDMGAKWSPVFGRYSYWNPKSPTQTFKVGDEVNVTKVNDGRTVWTWKGLS